MTAGPKYSHGHFVWREIMTTDVEDAKGFYGELFNWTFEDAQMPGTTYWLIKAGGREVAGAMPMPPEAGEIPPHWMSYVSVPDVDATTEAATAAGGSVGVAPTDIPPVGRFSVFGDPTGAWITAFRASDGDGHLPEQPGVGEFCWETLFTTDPEQAKRFYTRVFGWELREGPAGPNSVFGVGDASVADVEAAPGTPSSWLTYVVVNDLDDACRRLEQLGGRVVQPRHDIPNLGAIAVFADRQGAHLGLFQGAA